MDTFWTRNRRSLPCKADTGTSAMEVDGEDDDVAECEEAGEDDGTLFEVHHEFLYGAGDVSGKKN